MGVSIWPQIWFGENFNLKNVTFMKKYPKIFEIWDLKNGPSQYVDFTHLACSRPIFDSIFELYAPFYLLEKSFWAFFCIILEIIEKKLPRRAAAGKSPVFRSRKYLRNEKWRKIVNFQNWELKFCIFFLFPLNLLWLKF